MKFVVHTVKCYKIRKGLLTLIWPFLIFDRVPTSRTGVFPVLFFSCSGPIFGLLSPYLSVFPNINHEKKRRRPSTTVIGSHLRSHIEKPKVEVPSISLGKTCNCKTDERKGEPG